MKNWKRYLAVLTAGVMGASLTACQGSAGGADSQNSDSNTLTVSIWDNNQLPGLTEIMGDFTE